LPGCRKQRLRQYTHSGTFTNIIRETVYVDTRPYLCSPCGCSYPPCEVSAQVTSRSAYRNAALPVEQRLDDLLKRMTVEEKAAQCDMYWGRELTEDGKFSEAKAGRAIGSRGIGSVHDLYPSSAEVSNQIQRYAKEKTRLGIPVLIPEETLHGYVGKGSTTFPQSIAIASSWNRALTESIGRAIVGKRVRMGCTWVLDRILNLAREPGGTD